MSDTTTDTPIVLRPDTLNRVLGYGWEACSSKTANDGSIPYGTTVSSVICTSWDKDKTTVSGLIVGVPTVADNIISMVVTYPTAAGAGNYYIKIIATLSDASKEVYWIPEIQCKEYDV